MKNTTRFAELEYALQKYFDGKVAQVMKSVKDDLGNKQAEEYRSAQRGLGGILSMANFDKAGDTTMARLSITGKWNSKTVEDYVAMCRQKLHDDKSFQCDLITLAAEWRNAVVAKIGRARYDQLSRQLGGDLAYAYVGTRMDDLMIEQLVKDHMPKSIAEYIIRKAAQGSIWGLEQELTKSPLAREIEARGEKAFRPGKGAKVAGKVGSSAVDAVTMGVGSWRGLAKFIGADALIGSLFKGQPTVAQKEQVMETVISKAVFDSNANVFTGFRKQATQLQNKDNPYLSSLNSKLNSKIVIPQKPFMDINLLDATKRNWFPSVLLGSNKPASRTGKYKDVPIIVAPGQEDAYLEAKAKAEAQRKAEEAKDQAAAKAKAAEAEAARAKEDKTQNEAQSVNNPNEGERQQNTNNGNNDSDLTKSASNGWEQLLQASGLNGMGSTMANLGYVVSMLPDVLIGMLTGNTKTLGLKNTMMPLASILLGMFVRNPILKLALIGFGGANLLNKAGKESIGWQHQQTEQGLQQARNSNYAQPRYRQYADEELNPRITNPMLQGTTLIANIDKVPCNIQLTDNVVAAYQAGALPLNTLANAVLAKYDAQHLAAQRQYGEVEQQARQLNQIETVHRSR